MELQSLPNSQIVPFPEKATTRQQAAQRRSHYLAIVENFQKFATVYSSMKHVLKVEHLVCHLPDVPKVLGVGSFKEANSEL